MVDEADSGARRLVLAHGRERARLMLEPEKRPLADIAAEVMADEDGRMHGFEIDRDSADHAALDPAALLIRQLPACPAFEGRSRWNHDARAAVRLGRRSSC